MVSCGSGSKPITVINISFSGMNIHFENCQLFFLVHWVPGSLIAMEKPWAGAAAPLRDPAETDETRPQGLEDAEHPRDPGAGAGMFGGETIDI